MSNTVVILLVIGLLLIFITIPLALYAKNKQDKKNSTKDDLNKQG